MAKSIGAVRASLENCHNWAERKQSRRLESYIEYATELFAFLIEPLNLWRCEEDKTEMPKISEEMLLNGAKDWQQYSRDGNSLIFNRDICHRIIEYPEWRHYKDGAAMPHKYNDWLDAQAACLSRAAKLLIRISNG